MNKRIKELADEAGVSIMGANEKGVFTLLSDKQKKFAELIVRECARALDDKLSNPNGASMAWCDGSDLLEHFGVE